MPLSPFGLKRERGRQTAVTIESTGFPGAQHMPHEPCQERQKNYFRRFSLCLSGRHGSNYRCMCPTVEYMQLPLDHSSLSMRVDGFAWFLVQSLVIQ